MMRIYVRQFVLLTIAVMACIAGAPTPALAQPSAPTDTPGLGIRLLEAPIELANDPRAGTYIIDNLPPGTDITRRIEISNRTGAPQSVEIYTGAAHLDKEDGFVLEEGAAVNELTTWMSVDRPVLEIADGDVADLTVAIRVPPDAPEGEQYAVVWAQIAGADPLGSGARVVNRVGVRTYLSVGPGNGPAADFTINTLTAQRNSEGVPEVTAEFTNTGGRAVDVSGQLTLNGGPAGLSAGPFSSVIATVAPGEQGKAVFALDAQLPDGPWTVTAELASGILHRQEAGTLTFSPTGTDDLESRSAAQSATNNWTWAAVAVILIAALGLLLIRRRRATTR